RRRDGEEEHEDDDGAGQRAHLGAGEQPGQGWPAAYPLIAGRRRGDRRLECLAHGNLPVCGWPGGAAVAAGRPGRPAATGGPYRVPRSAYVATLSTLLASMKAGPVSTVWPPPRMSPLVRYSHSESMDM